MNSEHRHELEKNELAATVQKYWERAKSGTLVSPRIIGYVVAVLLILGLWWYLADSGKSLASAQWRDLEQTATVTELEKYATTTKNPVASRIAELQLARVKMSVDGLAKLNSRNPEVRNKAIQSIEEAKGEFVKLAEEFKKDPTLRSQCLDLAAKAEIALVGVPKSAGSTEFKGSVAAAIEHVKAIADTVGKDTVAGKAALERVANLEKNREEIATLGKELETELTPPPVLNPPKLPDASGLGNPITPKPGSDMKLPEGISPSTVPPPSPTPAPNVPAPNPSTPGTVPPPPPAPKTPPGAAAAGGAATSTPPTKK